MKSWNFPTRKITECLFRRFVCFRNFPLKRRKQPETELMVSLANHQSVLFVLMGHIYIESCSSFMIHTGCHTSKKAPLWHPRSFFFSFESPQGSKKLRKELFHQYLLEIFNCFKEINFYKPNGIV